MYGLDRNDATAYVKEQIEKLRLRLLDLSRRNPLISTQFRPQSNSHIRVVDELPDVLFSDLRAPEGMRLIPLPGLDDTPKDEETEEFHRALSVARYTDTEYREAIAVLDAQDDRARALERDLRDRVRAALSMPPRQTRKDLSLEDHARVHGIDPSYELPVPNDEHEDGRHRDLDIQTLLLPADLERKLRGLRTKCRSWSQETGINVLHTAFGFLEWSNAEGSESSFSPIVLLPTQIDERRTRSGYEYWINGNNEAPEANLVLAEKLSREYGIDLPEYDGGSIEDYFVEIGDLNPAGIRMKIRRQVAVGVFPSARMAMYHDLDTSRHDFFRYTLVKRVIGGSVRSASGSFAEEYDTDAADVEAAVPHLVMDADSSQFSALVDIARGTDAALEGPPGTGKSQTIVNAIAAALGDGKKVLFVAAKQAALSVVQSRLEALGLGHFVLPLQADRASRKAVIDSVGRRIAMAKPEKSARLTGKREAFRRTRSRLAEYIGVMSSRFGETGRTVHDILGWSIGTSDRLGGKPGPLTSPPALPGVERWSRERTEALRLIGSQIEEAWRKATDAGPYWQNQYLPHLTPFVIDDVRDRTGKAARAYAEVDRCRAALTDYALSGDLTLPRLEDLRDSLNSFSQEPRPVVELGARIFREKLQDDVANFLETYGKANEDREYISRNLVDADSLENKTNLLDVRNAVSELNISGVSIENAKAAVEESQSSLTKWQATLKEVKQFMKACPELADTPIAALREARNIISGVPKQVLALRSPETVNPAAIPVVRATIEHGRQLRDRRSEIDEAISTTTVLPYEIVFEHISVLAGSSFLSRIGRRYKDTKRFYLAISKRNYFDPDIATSDLQRLMDWIAELQEYNSDSRTKIVFGLSFAGIDTDFDAFEALMGYLEDVDRLLAGPANRAIRHFCKSEDIEQVFSLPDIDKSVSCENCDELARAIEEKESQLARKHHALSIIERHVSAFRSPESVDLALLDRLAEVCHAYEMSRLELEADGVVRTLIGEDAPIDEERIAHLQRAVGFATTIGTGVVGTEVLLDLLERGSMPEAIEALSRAIDSERGANDMLQELEQETGVDVARLLEETPREELSDWLTAAAAGADGLRIHSDFQRRTKELKEEGLEWVVNALLSANDSLTGLADTLDAVVARSVARKVYERHGEVLGRFPGTDLDDHRKELAKLDREILRLTADEVRFNIYDAADPPSGNSVGPKSTWSERSLLEHETGKKRAHRPVRELTQRAGKALLEYKPCWMMSPLAVAQYLPGRGIEFDLCIIDEASQMPPEDAIGALARCRQTLIVGDTNQLPPTSFFQKMLAEDDEDEDGEAILEESILEFANTAFHPKRRLRWHYRSRYSSLIKFSNHFIYDNDLIVFPSSDETHPNRGVSLIEVEGNYRSGANSNEAERIIVEAVSFMKNDGNWDRSLGIVTVNQKQKDIIEDGIYFERTRDSAVRRYIDKWEHEKDGLEPFFVKNLENVQGDERDVIFIGTVYGPENPGTAMAQRFGPINGTAGRRRLNVLFTRAKEQIVTFTSMKPSDIRADEDGNPGAYLLRRWLEYSRTGELHTGGESAGTPDSPFEEYVIDQIRAMGCEAVSQVGVKGYFIDIGVKHPDWPYGYLMGVECDGASWHSSRSARDRDRLRQEVLEGLGWNLHRIWSTDWFDNPRKEAGRLREAIQDRLASLQAADRDSHAERQEAVASVEQEETDASLETAEPEAEIWTEDRTSDEKVDTEPEVATGAVEIGDSIQVRYLTGAQNTLEVTISRSINRPDQGIVHVSEPLARALLDSEAEEGDEIEVLVGNYVRRALVERITKPEGAGEIGVEDLPEKTVDGQQTIGPKDHETSYEGDHIAEPTQPAFFEDSATMLPFDHSHLRPEQFYEPGYLRVVRRIATQTIDAAGPVRFDHLSSMIARAHGFNRTGSRIKGQVWKAVSRVRPNAKSADGATLFWPEGQKPAVAIPFRGMTVAGIDREWHQVPYPEKLGLAREVLANGSTGRHIEEMSSRIGLGRLHRTTKGEIEDLLRQAANMGGNV